MVWLRGVFCLELHATGPSTTHLVCNLFIFYTANGFRHSLTSNHPSATGHGTYSVYRSGLAPQPVMPSSGGEKAKEKERRRWRWGREIKRETRACRCPFRLRLTGMLHICSPSASRPALGMLTAAQDAFGWLVLVLAAARPSFPGMFALADLEGFEEGVELAGICLCGVLQQQLLGLLGLAAQLRLHVPALAHDELHLALALAVQQLLHLHMKYGGGEEEIRCFLVSCTSLRFVC